MCWVPISGKAVSLGPMIFTIIADYEEDPIFSYIYIDRKRISHMITVAEFGIALDGTVRKE